MEAATLQQEQRTNVEFHESKTDNSYSKAKDVFSSVLLELLINSLNSEDKTQKFAEYLGMSVLLCLSLIRNRLPVWRWAADDVKVVAAIFLAGMLYNDRVLHNNHFLVIRVCCCTFSPHLPGILG